MYNELNIKIGTKNTKAFLQDGFYSGSMQTTAMHKHNYAEIHLVDLPLIEYNIGNTVHSTANGNLLIIPKNVFHCIKNTAPSTRHIAFQIDYDVKEFSSHNIDPKIVLDFADEIEKCKKTNDHTSISAYISLFCSYFCSEMTKACPITDYSFLICEFLSRHYQEDVHLSDLASVLHLSERQTERLVIKSTGNTFLKELSEVRMNVAEHLSKTTDMTLEEISRYIGYSSYAGFWKAKKRRDG